MSCPQVRDPKKKEILTEIGEKRSKINEVVQLYHRKICLTDTGYNQILAIKDHFIKMADSVPSQTASEETCDHLNPHWISRFGFTMISDNVKGFAGN